MSTGWRLSRREMIAGSLAGAGLWLAGCSTSGDAAAPAASGASGSSVGSTAVLPAATLLPPLPVAAPERRFGPGDRPDPSKPEGTDLLPRIEHVVVLMMENHSFDNYFGMLGRVDGFTLGPDGKPINANPGPDGSPVVVHHLPTTSQVDNHVTQNWTSSHRQFNGGAMNGFARTSGVNGMGYWTGDDLPFYWSLAKTFPLADRWFASVLAQTYPNRRFLQSGTALGLLRTVLPKPDDPAPPNGTVFDQMNRYGISWRNYTAGLPETALYPSVYLANRDKVGTIDGFLTDAASGQLPSVSWITPHPGLSEENPQDIQKGESFSAKIINAVLQSPLWAKTVLFFLYDEHGGYYDHVPPPLALPPDDVPPAVQPDDLAGGFGTYGFRVPAIVVSPFARPDHVSHTVYDHTSLLRFIATKWNLPALTLRDANATTPLDCLDLEGEPAFLRPPPLSAPALAEPGPPDKVTD